MSEGILKTFAKSLAKQGLVWPKSLYDRLQQDGFSDQMYQAVLAGSVAGGYLANRYLNMPWPMLAKVYAGGAAGYFGGGMINAAYMVYGRD